MKIKSIRRKIRNLYSNGPRLGTNVIEAKGVAKAYGDKLLYDNLNFTLPQAGIVGIIGPNGAGKSTIFRMIMGEEKPDAGEFVIGDTVRSLTLIKRILILTLINLFGKISVMVKINYDGRASSEFSCVFKSFQLWKRSKQKSFNTFWWRVTVYTCDDDFKEEGNVLLLDEPTNDLDINTLRALEEGLDNFAGCAVISRQVVPRQNLYAYSCL
jgi:ABC-type multidrug transport system ATPase subunit